MTATNTPEKLALYFVNTCAWGFNYFSYNYLMRLEFHEDKITVKILDKREKQEKKTKKKQLCANKKKYLSTDLVA